MVGKGIATKQRMWGQKIQMTPNDGSASTLEKTLSAIAVGLDRQAETSPEYPSSNLSNPDFGYQVRQNQICAVGWLLFCLAQHRAEGWANLF